jgi:excisionase family DNA binding protein
VAKTNLKQKNRDEINVCSYSKENLMNDAKRQTPNLERNLTLKDVMTPREAAHYLSVHVRTIYRLARDGEIPGRKVGGSWRFKKDTLDQWLSGNNDIPTPPPRRR